MNNTFFNSITFASMINSAREVKPITHGYVTDAPEIPVSSQSTLYPNQFSVQLCSNKRFLHLNSLPLMYKVLLRETPKETRLMHGTLYPIVAQ